MAYEYPAWGRQRASNELRKQGIFISGGGVRSVWQRHDLEVFELRLKVLEAFIDTYSRVAFAKLYESKTELNAADTLNDRVLPFFESHQIP